MKKIFIAAIVIIGVVLAVLGYQYVSGGDAVEISVRSLKGQWRFDPSEIVVPANKKVRVKIFNEDPYEHGFAIRKLGVDVSLPPQKETVVKIPAAAAGEYEFVCSVICGEGHNNQTGVYIVR